jgi:hypothetical protein
MGTRTEYASVVVDDAGMENFRTILTLLSATSLYAVKIYNIMMISI